MTSPATKELPHRTELFNVRLWQEAIDETTVEVRGQVQHLLSGETHYFRDWATLVAQLETMWSQLAADDGRPAAQQNKKEAMP